MTDIASVYAVFGSADEARNVARAAVEEGLAACANILAPCHSIYRWEGRIEEASEIPVLFKTRSELADRLIGAIEAMHSYEVPAAVAWKIEAAIPAYEAWVKAETKPEAVEQPASV